MATKREDGGPYTVREARKGGRGLARKRQERDHLHFARGINVRNPCTLHNERAAAQERASAAPPQGHPLDSTPSWWQREHDDGAGTRPAAPCRRRSPPSATTVGPSQPFQCSHFTLRATALLIHRRQPLAVPFHRKQPLSPRVHTTAVGHRAGHSGNAHHLSHRQSRTHHRYRRHGGRAAKVEREATKNRGQSAGWRQLQWVWFIRHSRRHRHGNRIRRHGGRSRSRHRQRCHRHYRHDRLPRHSPSLQLLPPWEPPANRQADAAVILINGAARYTRWTRQTKQLREEGQVLGGGKASQRRYCCSACRRGGVRRGGARPPVPVQGALNTVYGRSHRRPEGLHAYVRAG